MKKYTLVTGGAGYIGSHVVRLLGERGENLIVIDNYSTGHPWAVLFGKKFNIDLLDLDKMENIFNQFPIESIIHFAGSIVVPDSVTDPLFYYKNNLFTSHNLIHLAKKYQVRNFIFSSSAAVYGHPNVSQIPEDFRPNPLNPYGHTKLMTEQILQDTSHSLKDFQHINLRYFNVAGASMDGKLGQTSKKSTHLIKICAEAAVGKREKVSIFGTDYPTSDGTCVRDYIHVEDLADAHFKALLYLRRGGTSQTLNCGHERGHSVREIIQVTQKVSPRPIKVEECQRRAGDPPILVAQAKKIREILNWRPVHDNIFDIIRSAIRWEEKLFRKSRKNSAASNL